MRLHRIPSLRAILPVIGLLLAAVVGQTIGAQNSGLRVLIVGGGPEPHHNQVAIERNVAYVTRLLPAGAPRRILFADGDPSSKNVAYEEEPRTLPPAERAFALLFLSRDEATPTMHQFRAPQLGRLDGASKRADITKAFEWLRQGDPGRVLLYFTGHGSQARDRNLDNNDYDLWGERLSVRDLAAHIATLPRDVPVTLVMVQCFSGAFGNLVFSGGDPNGAPVDREIAGFFAAPRERTAAGCTTEVNEAEYHDFTSYFFAALTGRDRVGRAVGGADYNHDGRVGMDEAFDYSLIHDVSIDVPVCTSDVFVRRVVTCEDPEVFRTEYSTARAWATPGQAAALDALSRALGLAGEARLGEAYRLMVAGNRRGAGPEMRQALMRFRQAREEARQPLLDRWPDLRQRSAAGFAAARREALVDVGRRAQDGRLHELFAADEALGKAEEQQFQTEITDARVLRLVRLAKSVILAHRLRETGDTAARERFERLIAAEARPLLPPAAVATAPRG